MKKALFHLVCFLLGHDLRLQRLCRNQFRLVCNRHQLADGTGYRGIFVSDSEFRFAEEIAA